MERLPCPDGFLVNSDDPHRHAHEQINLWMVEMEEVASKRPNHPLWLDIKDLKKQFTSSQQRDLLQAAIIRAQYLTGDRGDFSAPSLHGRPIYRILFALARLPLTLSDDQLLPLLKASIGRGQCAWPREAVCDHIEEEFQHRALKAETWRLIHELHDGMSGENSIEAQTLRRRLAVLLWHDPYNPVELKNCWSETIRRDLRAMPGRQRAQWHSVFAAIPVSDSTEPPGKWKKAADSHIAAIGAEQFRQQLLEWFAPFHGGEPVRLTMVGSHVLKALLWYCRLLRDPKIDAAALSLLNVKWRNKDFIFRPLTVLAGSVSTLLPEDAWPILLRILGALGSKSSARLEKVVIQVAAQQGLTEDDLRSFGILKPRHGAQPQDVYRILRTLAKMNWGSAAVSNGTNSKFQYDGDYVEIQGQRDRYRAHVPSCTVRRVRDNAIVELDLDRVPDYWRSILDPDQTEFQRFELLLFLLAMDEQFDFFATRADGG